VTWQFQPQLASFLQQFWMATDDAEIGAWWWWWWTIQRSRVTRE
jgi:hypothetical protein